MSDIQTRIRQLIDFGMHYNEVKRRFECLWGSIDQDVVQYGNDELFEKEFNKVKRKFEKK